MERSDRARLAYSVPQVGELLGDASEVAVRHLIARHKLPARRLGQRRVVVLAQDLEQYLAALPRIENELLREILPAPDRPETGR